MSTLDSLVLRVAVGAVAVVGMAALLGGDAVLTSPASSTSATSAPVWWVVESVGYHRTASGQAWSVVCVPLEDLLALPFEDRPRWREVATDPQTADTAAQGQPCPVGPILQESP